MENKDFYTWIALKGSVVYSSEKNKLEELRAPFTFVLLPLVDNLEARELEINEGQELIYFKRVRGQFNLTTSLNEVTKILYCLGKRIDNYTKVSWINPITNEETAQIGSNIKL